MLMTSPTEDVTRRMEDPRYYQGTVSVPGGTPIQVYGLAPPTPPPAGTAAYGATPGMPPEGTKPEPYDLAKQVGSAIQTGVANYHHLAGNIFSRLDALADAVAKGTGTTKGGFYGDLAQWSKDQQEIAEKEAAKLAGGRQDFWSQLTRAPVVAATQLPLYVVGGAAAEMTGAGELAGSIPYLGRVVGGASATSMAAIGALENADRGWKAALQGAAEGSLMGKFMDVMGPLNRPIRLTGIGLVNYAQLRLQGADNETALANAMTQSGMSYLGGPGTVGVKDLAKLPGQITVGVKDLAKLPGQMRIPNQLNPLEQQSQQYMTERGIETPLSMQTGSEAAQQLEASIRKSPGGGAFGRKLEAAKQQLIRTGQEQEFPRIYPEAVTEEEAGAAVGGKLATDLENTRKNLLQQVSPEATTPESAGQAVIDRGKQVIQGLDREANQAYKQAWQAEKDPRNVREIPVLDENGDAKLDENGKPVTEKMPLPIDMQDIKDALKPIVRRYEYTLSETDARASLGLKTMRQIIAGARYKPVSAAELDLSMLKEAARTEKGLAELRDPSQGMAAFSVGKLQSAIDDTMGSAAYPGHEPFSGTENPAITNLRAGRAATAKKYAVADAFANLGRTNINELEPVGVQRRLTWGGDAGVNQLRAIAQIAPDQMPAVGRAFIEGGGKWSELGPETKKILFRDPKLIEALDQYHADQAQFGPLTKLEPVDLFNRLTRPGARTINQLRAVAEQAPEEMRKLGRAFVEGLLERSTREGELEKVKSTLNKWMDLDAQSKKIMFEDPALVRDLDAFFFSLKRMMENPNPSGSGFMMGLNQMKGRVMTGLGMAAGSLAGTTHGAPGVGIGAGLGIMGGVGLEVLSNSALARLLYNPRFIRMVTRGMDMQNSGNAAGARLMAGQILKDFPPKDQEEGGAPPPAPPGGEPPAGGGAAAAAEPSLKETAQAMGDAALERIKQFWSEEKGTQSVPDPKAMKDMVIWARSKIAQGLTDPVGLRKAIAEQFGKLPRTAIQEIAGKARDQEIKAVKPWRLGMSLDDIHPLTSETIPMNPAVEPELGEEKTRLYSGHEQGSDKRIWMPSRQEAETPLSSAQSPSNLSYIDVPTEEAAKYRAGGEPEAKGRKLMVYTPGEAPERTGRLLTEDVQHYLEDMVRKRLGDIPDDAPAQVKMRRMLQYARREFDDQLRQPYSGVDWYGPDTSEGDRLLRQVHPELADPDFDTIQKAMSAAMSNNSNPRDEAFNGARIWKEFFDGWQRNPNQTPQFPQFQPGTEKNWSAQGANFQIAKLNQMIRELGVAGTAEFLRDPAVPGRVIKHFVPNAKEIRLNDLYSGSQVLGPKIGVYFNQIMNIPLPGSVVDVWMMRRNGRLLGRLFDDNGKAIEAPRTEGERILSMDLDARLARQHNLATRDAQSVGWHYEQELYRRLGLDVKSFRRSDGIHKYLQLLGIE
jgi:hypothetical protein